MSKLLSDAAAALAKAGHAKRTPEQRSQKAAKAASARWEGNGLTSDQRRVLRKLVSAGKVSAKIGKGVSGRRFSSAVCQLDSRGLIVVLELLPDTATYRRGPHWRPDLVK